MTRAVALSVAVTAAVALLVAAQPVTAKPKVSGEITVFAASSLTESFGAIKKDFEEKYAGVTAKFNFDASSNLAAQIQQGARADVFASADEANLRKTIDSGDVAGPPLVFARNRLEIAVEEGNPKKIKALADLARPDVVVILCADEAPCGKYAAQAFAKAGVDVSPASKEENAKAALAKVSLGEADAAVVYVTDVRSEQGNVRGVTIRDEDNVVATYPVGVVKDGRNAPAAKAWSLFLESAKARKTLQKFGFLAP
jgi:molybdate transport system substrate-binding protein